ncbi:MAG: MoxR family ATPase [Bryobacteraceae bacterium]|nr:MoxR family ATPase [Bryobacteraceae bacterium]
MTKLPADLENRTRKPSEKKVALAEARRSTFRDPSAYQPDPDLVDAMRVALLLRKPLLVTGEPGTGKTDLGRYLAWKCGFLFFQFDSKSTSVARDLHYYYDALGRFQASQSGGSADASQFLRLNALGEAILQSRAFAEIPADMRHVLPPDFEHTGPRQSVVVIDEVDKAPRDFPNDLLNELENHYFRIAELGVRPVRAGNGLEPVLVITSNSEKNLPAPFLRRCVYYNIEFPSDSKGLRNRLREIVAARLPEFDDENETAPPMLRDVLEVFELLRRDASGLTKKPATAELLDWLVGMLELGGEVDMGLDDELARRTIPALVKHATDRVAALTVLKDWFARK